MSVRSSRPVRLSDRRGSIGVAILMAVSLSILGAQTVMGTGAAAHAPAATAAR